MPQLKRRGTWVVQAPPYRLLKKFLSLCFTSGHDFTGCGKRRFLVELAFTPVSKSLLFDLPSGLQSARRKPFQQTVQVP
jgi:hypothetical protein